MRGREGREVYAGRDSKGCRGRADEEGGGNEKGDEGRIDNSRIYSPRTRSDAKLSS